MLPTGTVYASAVAAGRVRGFSIAGPCAPRVRELEWAEIWAGWRACITCQFALLAAVLGGELGAESVGKKKIKSTVGHCALTAQNLKHRHPVISGQSKSSAGDSGFATMVDGCSGPSEAGDGGADPAATALAGTGGSPAIGPDAAVLGEADEPNDEAAGFRVRVAGF